MKRKRESEDQADLAAAGRRDAEKRGLADAPGVEARRPGRRRGVRRARGRLGRTGGDERRRGPQGSLSRAAP